MQTKTSYKNPIMVSKHRLRINMSGKNWGCTVYFDGWQIITVISSTRVLLSKIIAWYSTDKKPSRLKCLHLWISEKIAASPPPHFPSKTECVNLFYNTQQIHWWYIIVGHLSSKTKILTWWETCQHVGRFKSLMNLSCCA